MARSLILSQGKIAFVDDADYERAAAFKWSADKHGRKTETWYAVRCVKGPEGRWNRKIYLHRFLLGVPDDIEIDHRDGDGLNNRRSNLRQATRTGNARNLRRGASNMSGYKGVSWSAGMQKWLARITVDRVKVHLGYHSTIEDAASAYAEASRKFHGEFGRV